MSLKTPVHCMHLKKFSCWSKANSYVAQYMGNALKVQAETNKCKDSQSQCSYEDFTNRCA